MKKKNEVGIEESLAARNETHCKLDVVGVELRKATSILKNRSSDLDTATRALEAYKKSVAEKQYSLSGIRSFESALAPKFYEERLNEAERSEYAACQQLIYAASAELADAQKQFDSLKDEERSLLAELFGAGDSLAEALLFQGKLDEAERKVTGILEAISDQNGIVEKASRSIPSIDELLRKREDILAEIVLGNAKESALVELDRQIESETAKVSGAKGGAKAATELAQQIIAGLQRKLPALQDELAALKDQRKGVLIRFLMSEAEKVGIEYSRLAGDLVVKFRQLSALDSILTDVGAPSIADGTYSGFIIPCFDLRCHADEMTDGWFFGGVGILSSIMSDGIAEGDLQAEKDRIAGSGVTI